MLGKLNFDELDFFNWHLSWLFSYWYL